MRFSAATVLAELDMLDDGALVLDVLLCAPCAERSAVSRGSLISGRDWEIRDSLRQVPNLVPTCSVCATALVTTHV
jgi:hypothetical protein